MKTQVLIAALFVLGFSQVVVAQDGPPPLTNNPFSRPPSDVIIDDRISVRSDEIESPTLELQATMIGSVNKLANVGGRILRTGDEVQGYRIVEIHEQYAVFERDGRRTTVYVKPLFAADQLAEGNE